MIIGIIGYGKMGKKIEQISITTQMEANGHNLYLRYLLFVISLSCMDITTLNQRR